MGDSMHRKMKNVYKVDKERVSKFPDTKFVGDSISLRSKLSNCVGGGEVSVLEPKMMIRGQDASKQKRSTKISRSPDIAAHLNLIEEEINLLSSKKMALANERYSVEGFCRQIKSEIAKLREGNAGLDQVVVEGKNRNKVLEEYKAKLLKDLEVLNQEIKESKESLKQKLMALSELKNAEAKVNEKLKSKSELLAKLARQRRDIIKLENDVVCSKNQLEILKEDSIKLLMEIERYGKARADLDSKINAYSGQTKLLQQQVNERQEELSKVKARLAESEKNLEEQTTLEMENNIQNEELAESLKKSAVTKLKLEEDLRQTLEDVHGLETQYKNLQLNLKEAKDGLKSMDKGISEQRKLREEARKQGEIFDAERREYEKRLMDLRATLEKNTEERKKLQIKLHETTKARNIMREEEKSILKEIEEIKRKDLEEKASKAQLSSNLKQLLQETNKLREKEAAYKSEKGALICNLNLLEDEICIMREAEANKKLEHSDAVQRVHVLSEMVTDVKTRIDQLEKENDFLFEMEKVQLAELEVAKDHLKMDAPSNERNLQSDQNVESLKPKNKEKVRWFGKKKKNVKLEGDQ